MDAGFLDVLHHAGDIDRFVVGDAIDIHLDRVVQVAVDQHRIVAGHAHRLAHVAMQAGAVVDDLHRTAAQHVARADHHRIADAFRNCFGFVGGACDAVVRLAQAETMQQLLEALAILGDVDRVGARAEDGDLRLWPGPATASAASGHRTARCSPAACRGSARGAPGRSHPRRSAARNTADRTCRSRC